jgi:hypothetical protein
MLSSATYEKPVWIVHDSHAQRPVRLLFLQIRVLQKTLDFTSPVVKREHITEEEYGSMLEERPVSPVFAEGVV